MRPHPKIRKTIKWGGAAVTVLLVVVWVGSAWDCAEWHARSGFYVFLGSGLIDVGRGSFPDDYPKFGLVSYRANVPLVLWQFYWHNGHGWDGWPTFQLRVPTWLPVIGAAIPALVAWRLDTLARRRARLNLCPKCNYDRAGIGAGAVCPECGTAPLS